MRQKTNMPMADYVRLVAGILGIDPKEVQVEVDGKSFRIVEDKRAPTVRRPDWARVLEIEDWQAATVKSVRAQHRKLSKIAHPDRGGSDKAQVAINQALQSAMAALE